MLLPNGARAFVEYGKLAQYCLSLDHSIGGHKARVFRRVLGLHAGDASALREILLSVASHAEAAPGRRDEFGQRYTIDFTIAAEAGAAVIRSAWIVRHAEEFPRLTTCYVLKV